MERFLVNYLSERTKVEYRRDLRYWRGWLDGRSLPLLNPGPSAASEWIAHMRTKRLADATLARKTSVISMFYRWARHDGLTTADPLPFKRPTVHSDDVSRLGLDLAVVVRVLAEARPGREQAFILLLFRSALRVSEALGADVRDVRTMRGRRVIAVMGKGRRPRTVPVPVPAAAALDAYLAGRATGPLFVTRTGRRWNHRYAYDLVRRVGKRAGVVVHPHLFRHTAITLMLDAGEPLDRVQEAAGHADPRTTVAYAKARRRLDTSALHGLARLLDGES